jgi:ABC-type phosphate transport system permease subunit
MAVTYVIGNFNQLDSLSLFQAAGDGVTSALANEFAEAGQGLAPGRPDVPGAGAVLHHLCHLDAFQVVARRTAAERVEGPKS